MDRFIPREKLGKKARKRLDSQRRAGWGFSPVTRKVESRKKYNRKAGSRERPEGFDAGSCFSVGDFSRFPFSGEHGTIGYAIPGETRCGHGQGSGAAGVYRSDPAGAGTLALPLAGGQTATMPFFPSLGQ